MGSDAQNTAATINLCRHVGHILTPQPVPHVPKVPRRHAVALLVARVRGEALVVREREDVGGVYEAGVVD